MLDAIIRSSLRHRGRRPRRRPLVLLVAGAVVAAPAAGRRLPGPHRADGHGDHRGARAWRRRRSRSSSPSPSSPRSTARRASGASARSPAPASRSCGPSSSGARTSTAPARSWRSGCRASALPRGVERPSLGPISSIMGEITFLALTSDTVGPLELRRLGETVVRRTLLALPGVSQVVPDRRRRARVPGRARPRGTRPGPAPRRRRRRRRSRRRAGRRPPASTWTAARSTSCAGSAAPAPRATSRPRCSEPGRRSPRSSPRSRPSASRPRPRGAPRPTGPGPPSSSPSRSSPGRTRSSSPARIDAALEGLQKTLPAGVVIEKENFRQADFIDVAIRNVSVALRDGAVLVLVVLFLFMGNLRATLISAAAIPLSLVVGRPHPVALRGHPQHDDPRRLHDRDRGARGRRDHRRRERLPAAAPGAGASPPASAGGARRGLPGLVRGPGCDPVRDAGDRPRLPARSSSCPASRAGSCGRSASPTSPRSPARSSWP